MYKTIVVLLISFSLIPSFLGADDLEYNLTDAISRGDFEYASELIKKGADVNKKQEPFNQAPIVMASLRGMEFIELLIENGADVNSKDQDNTTALINACLYGNTEAAKYLISKGADIKAVNKDDLGVLEAAELSENKRLIRFIKLEIAK